MRPDEKPPNPTYAVVWVAYTNPQIVAVSAYDDDTEEMIWEVFLDAATGQQISRDEYERRYQPPEED